MPDPLDEIAGQVRGEMSRIDAQEPRDLDGNVIEPWDFVPVEGGERARMAFVDGGNAALDESASFIVSLNRVCFTLYEGERRAEGGSTSEFFSFTSFFSSGGSTRSEARMFAGAGAGAERWMPDEEDLRVGVADADHRSRAAALPRKFAEWKLATWAAINELGEGDILVMDGPLQAGFEGNEGKYARELYDMAESKNVALCGLSKTSMATTRSGQTLLPPVHKAGLEARGRSRWYVPVGSQGGRWRSLVVRLHEESDYVFRLEILDKQYEREAGRVVSSLAANSRDPSIPGYPYGAIEADNVARVRGGHVSAARNSLMTKLMAAPEWGAYERSARSIDMHGRLNRVV